MLAIDKENATSNVFYLKDMKNKKNPFLRIFIFVAVLLLIAAAAAIGMFYYFFGITEPEGLSLASWPNRFTDNFSIWMGNDNGEIKIEEIGLERLDEYGLWLQVIDETGQEVFSRNKPENYPARYSASELISLSGGAYEQGYTVFVSSYESLEGTWSYLIGFPYAIGKHMLYYNGEHVGRLSFLFLMGISFILCFVLLFMVWYGFWLTRHLGRIAKGIGDISPVLFHKDLHAGADVPGFAVPQAAGLYDGLDVLHRGFCQ